MSSNEAAHSRSRSLFRSLPPGTSSMHRPYFAKAFSSASMVIANSAVAPGAATRPRSVFFAQLFVRIWLVWESICGGTAPCRLTTSCKGLSRSTSTAIPGLLSR